MKKIPKFKKKNRWRAIKIVGTQEKGVGTQENAVGASEKCRILCKNLQKLSKNEKFHKILQENYIFCAKTALAHDKSLAHTNDRWRTPTRWHAPTPVCANGLQCFLHQRANGLFVAYSVFCARQRLMSTLITQYPTRRGKIEKS